MAGPDDRHAEAITLRPAEQRIRPCTKPFDQPVDHGRQATVGDLELGVPRLHRATRSPSPGAAPRDGWPPRQRRGPGCGGLEVEVLRDEVLIAHRVAGEARTPALRAPRAVLSATFADRECRSPRPRGLGRRGVITQRRRRALRFDLDLRLQRGRPVVRVDQPGRVLVEAQTEQQVVTGDRVRPGNRAFRRPPGRAAPPSPLHALGARRARRGRDAPRPGGARRPGARRATGPGAARAWQAARRLHPARHSRPDRFARVGRRAPRRRSRRGTASPAAPPRRGSCAARPSSAPPPHGRRPLLLRGHRAPTDRAFRLPDEQPREVVAVHAPPRRRQQVVGQLEPDLEGAEGSAASRSPSSINCRVRAMSSSRVMPAPRRG